MALFLKEGGIEPPTVREVMERFRCDEKSVRDNLALLVRNGSVVRISNDLFYASTMPWTACGRSCWPILQKKARSRRPNTAN